MADQSFLNYFINADMVVKAVMLILLVASIISWTIILQRVAWLGSLRRKTAHFVQSFRGCVDVGQLFRETNKKGTIDGAESIFLAGYKEFARGKQLGMHNDALAQSTERAMLVANSEELARAEGNMSVLATIGSTSPYIGLFGTVWGIMNAFQALGHVQQATIAMVAPGISEALIATAMGLFAAIPAVIAYNRFTQRVECLSEAWHNFQAEFSNLVNRQTQVAAAEG